MRGMILTYGGSPCVIGTAQKRVFIGAGGIAPLYSLYNSWVGDNMNNITISCFYRRCLSLTKRKVCVNMSSLVISLVALAAPLRAEFVYVANFSSSKTSRPTASVPKVP
jgi:hypothetical protein